MSSYLDSGWIIVAVTGETIVGHLQLTETAMPGEIEITNLAVLPAQRRRGIGRALLEAAITMSRERLRSTVRVATAAADSANLRFHQRLGFRVRSIESDALTAATGYDPDARVDGIKLRVRVWLDRPIDAADQSTG